jgi:signal transduction histidine kinase/ligand-binding sensor domain-containing protein
VLLLLVCLMQPLAQARSARWVSLADTVFQHLTVDNGLPHGIVTVLSEDHHGFLWVGTQGGLARWDGYRFRTYQPNAKDPHSLPDNYVQAIHSDRRGRLWIGFNSGGLARYDEVHDRFIRVPLGRQGAQVSVVSISTDGADGLWIGTRSGLEHFDPERGSSVHYEHRDHDPASLPSSIVSSLLYDQQGRLWVGTGRGLAWFDAAKSTFVTVPLPVKNGEVRSISALKQTRDGRIWICTRGQGVFTIEPGHSAGTLPSGLPILALSSQDPALDLDHDDVFGLEQLENGQVWIATYGRGIVVWDQGRMHRVRHDAALASSLLDDTLWTIKSDRSGLVWLGTQRGISRYDPTHAAVLTVFGGSGRKISDPDVLALASLSDGSLWLGLQNGGVNIIAPAAPNAAASAPASTTTSTTTSTSTSTTAAPGSKVAWLKPDPLKPDSALPAASIQSIAQGADGSVYLGTRHGLYRSTLQHQSVSYIALPPRNPRSSVLTLLPLQPDLWLGGSDGLWRIEFDASAAARALRAPATDSLNNQYVNILLHGSDGAIWIGTRHTGLYRYDPVKQQLRHIDNGQQGLQGGLAHPNIATLLFDKRGRLWVGTQGGGISVLQQQSAPLRWQTIGMDQGLPNPLVDKLLEDDNGDIWASTDSGLVRIDPDSLTLQALQRAEGALVQTYWVNSGAKTAQGELLFGGAGGLTVVRPQQRARWQYRPPVKISQISVGGKALAPGPFNLPQAESAILKIQPQANSLLVEFAALDYSAPERNRYAYQLEGYDNYWIDTDPSRRLATYTNLPPGAYRLHLRGSNRNGEWTLEERILNIEVLPRWYQTWGFRVALLLLAAAGIYALVQGRTRYLRQRQAVLEFEVQQRTMELRHKQQQILDANRDLAGANSALNQSNAALNQSNSALSLANSGLAQSVETLRQLGDIGRDITANLDGQDVFLALYQYVGALLDADVLTIYRVNEVEQRLELAFGREDGRDFPSKHIQLNSPTSIMARVARERNQLMLEFASDQYAPSHIPGTRYMHSGLYAPLIVHERLIGVMSVQSHQQHAYGERECLIFRTLSAYGAIALANAEAMAALRQAQSQLLHQEKLVSLGTLTAGIAHEINNPSNFAHVGAYNLGTDLAALQAFLLQLAGDDTAPEVMRILQQHFDKLQQSLATISEGTTRIRDLVRDLRRFSRLDEADWKVVAIAESLQATINLVRTQYADQVEIRCQLDDNPELACWPAQLNQVFMNLIVNACQAIVERPAELQAARPGLLQVRSRLEPPWLVLEFEDNGSGIDPDIIKKIFDPFFTTKTVGDGMGMGLSISFGIIARHCGKITVRSQPGQGSCFTIYLPLEQQARPEPKSPA